MHFKKIISVWAILALAFAQIAIAQHNAVHLDHGFQSQIEQHADAGHEHEDKNTPFLHECPECLLTKTLQTAFHAGDTLALKDTLSENLFSLTETSFISNAVASAYNPRAPPILLI